MGVSNSKGGRPKGKYAILAIMRYGPDVIVTRKYTQREAACVAAQKLNQDLGIDEAVMVYCVRAVRKGWFKS